MNRSTRTLLAAWHVRQMHAVARAVARICL